MKLKAFHPLFALIVLESLGCGSVMSSLVNQAYGVDPAKSRVAGTNPLSGSPLRFGFERRSGSNCDQDYTDSGVAVSVRGDQLCLRERWIKDRRTGDGAPESMSAGRWFATNSGRTDAFELASSDWKRVARCSDEKGTFQVWADEVETCAANHGILTQQSPYLAVYWTDTNMENIGWKF